MSAKQILIDVVLFALLLAGLGSLVMGVLHRFGLWVLP